MQIFKNIEGENICIGECYSFVKFLYTYLPFNSRTILFSLNAPTESNCLPAISAMGHFIQVLLVLVLANYITHMGRFDQGVETQFLCHFVWCIARLVAPVQKLVQQIFFCKLII